MIAYRGHVDLRDFEILADCTDVVSCPFLKPSIVTFFLQEKGISEFGGWKEDRPPSDKASGASGSQPTPAPTHPQPGPTNKGVDLPAPSATAEPLKSIDSLPPTDTASGSQPTPSGSKGEPYPEQQVSKKQRVDRSGQPGPAHDLGLPPTTPPPPTPDAAPAAAEQAAAPAATVVKTEAAAKLPIDATIEAHSQQATTAELSAPAPTSSTDAQAHSQHASAAEMEALKETVKALEKVSLEKEQEVERVRKEAG